jgi:hypothetical protein
MTFTDTRILEGLTAAAYFAIDAVSRSDLAQVLKNPHHFKHWKATNETTPAMKLGTMVHELVLEGLKPLRGACVVPVADCLTKKGEPSKTPKTSEIWKARAARAEKLGDDIYLDTEAATIRAEVQAIADAATAEHGGLFASARKEVVITATHAATGMKVKARLDLLGDAFAADLKTTKDASSEAFASSVGKFRYDLQAAFYGDLGAAALGLDACPFWFACVESEAPYTPGLWDLSDVWIENGRNSYEQALETYAIYEAKGWPTSYGRGTLEPKPWMIG